MPHVAWFARLFRPQHAWWAPYILVLLLMQLVLLVLVFGVQVRSTPLVILAELLAPLLGIIFEITVIVSLGAELLILLATFLSAHVARRARLATFLAILGLVVFLVQRIAKVAGISV